MIRILLLLLIFIYGCGASDPVEVVTASANEINPVLQKELSAFQSSGLPDSIFNKLLNYKVLIFGEFHTILEERIFAIELVKRLNTEKEETNIFAECPCAYSWVFEKYSFGTLDVLPENIYYSKVMGMLDSLHIYNLHNGTKAKLFCIDANLNDDQFLNSLKAYSEFLDNEKLTEFYNIIRQTAGSDYNSKLKELKNILFNNPSDLGFESGTESFSVMSQMVDDEITSFSIRSNWNSDYISSFSKRENLIKENAEYLLNRYSGTALIYFGLNHAQKKGYLGTNVEWLGDYLHNTSRVAVGKTISIVGVPLSGEISDGNEGTGTIIFNLVKESSDNDLFRLVGEKLNGDYGWLPLEDSFFSDKKIKIKYIYPENEINIPPGRQFDIFYFFPKGSYAGW